MLKVFWELIKEGYFNPLIFDLFVTTFTPYLEGCMHNLPGVVSYNGRDPTSDDSLLTIENIHMIYLITSVFCDSKDNVKQSELMFTFESGRKNRRKASLFSKYLINKIGEIFTLENINMRYTKLCVVLSKLKDTILETADHSGWSTGKTNNVVDK